ncbi:MAG: Ig-like domain-containing protein [Anaerolineae bacterium]
MKKYYTPMTILILCAMVIGGLMSACAKPTPIPTATPAPTHTPAPTSTPAPTPIPLPPVPPQVLRRMPAPGEEQGLTAPVVIAFDQPMDRLSTERAFEVQPAVAGSFNWPNDTTLAFAPTVPFVRGESYKVTVAEEAKSAEGLALKEPFSFHFSAVGHLEVTEVQPAPDTTEVATDALVTVMFNRPVVPLSAISEQAGLPQPLTLRAEPQGEAFAPPVTGEGQWLNTSIYTFRPEEGFDPATTYTARVAAGLEDTTGGVLAEDYTWYFTTAMPAVVWTVPADGDVQVAATQAISMTFNQLMDHASVEERFFLATETGTVIQGDFRWEEKTMAFAPSAPLALETSYVATLEAGAKAARGEGLIAEPYSWRFTTVPYPRIVETIPADGNLKADPYGGMELYFASPMDPTTIMPNTTVIPEPTEVYTYWSDYDNRFFISFDIQPSTSYTFTFGAEIAAPYGNTLGQDQVVRFTTRNLDPMAYLNTPGNVGTYNAYTETVAYATYRNVSRLDFGLYRLDREDFIRLNGNESWDYWDKFSPHPEALVRQWSEEVDAPLNQAGVLSTKVTSEEGGTIVPGLYYLEVTAPEMKEQEYWQPSRQIMVVSRLNLTLKQGETEALVWATDLASGQVVPGLPVSLQNESVTLAEGQTDKDGVFRAEFPRQDMWNPFFVFAGEGDNFAAAINRWNQGISPWEFNIPAQFFSQPYSGYFYTDRPIYRPGQMVRFKGILRTDDDARYGLPEGVKSLTVTVMDDQGKEVYREDLPISDMGTLHGEFALDEEAILGYYFINAQLGDQGFGVGFRVAEYRKPEFEVAVGADRDAYVQGDEIAVSAVATYYFGGPVAEAQVHWSVLSQDYFFPWQGKGYYDFVDYEWEERGQYYGAFGELIAEGTGETDGEGRFTFKVPADIAMKKLSQVFTIEASVTDINDQQVSSRTEAIVHKGLFYIGLTPRAWVGTVGEEQQVDVITVDWESQPVPNVPLTVTFFEHKWYSVQEKAEDGSFYWTSKVEDTPVLTTTVTTDAEGKAVAAFIPEKGGTYKVLAVGHDERGNEIRSATYLWVSSGEYISWRRENHDRIELIPDKKSYTPGEVAKILIPSPYQGEVKALLTIERGHIMSYQLLTLQSNSELIEIPILSEHTPNVYVSVVIVKGQDETNPLASLKVGYAALPVSTVEKELKITITPDKEDHYGPRETVTYDIRATDYRGMGVTAELSLALVDLSVLALAEESAPTLVQHFYGQRGVGIQTAASLALSVDRLNLLIAQKAKGGGGGPEAAAAGLVRREFPDTAYWNPTVRTNEDGRAQVSVQLPDTLTTWRLGVKGITAATEVGEAKGDVISTLDLLVRPVAPRFFVIGDKATLSAVVHNNTDQALEVEVSLSAEGLEIEGGAQRVQVPAHGKQEVSWPVTVGVVEQTKLLFAAQGGGLSDAVEITLPVYHYSTPEVVATAGQLDEAGERLEVVYLPERHDPTQGELTIQLDPSLAAGMRDGLKYLEHYPYECIEQTVSRFLPNVMTYRALRQLGIEDQELAARLPQQVSIALQRIYTEQHYDGGWGWWLADDSNAFLTAYVLLGLNEAKRADFVVDQEVMDRAAKFLGGSLKRPAELKEPYQANTQAFILYVLAECGKGDLGRSVALYERREMLGNYGKAYLAMALGLLAPEQRERVDAILSDLTSAAVLSATGAHWEEESVDYWTMNTDTRSTAIVLAALARLAPDSGIAPNVVRWLMVARKEGHWLSTQETAWSLIALTDWMVATGELEADYSYRVSLNQEKLGEGKVTKADVGETRKLQVDVARLLKDEANRLLIERLEPTGKGRLYYSLYLRYFLPVEDVKALSRGIIVARQYSPVDQPERFVDGAKVGDVIKVKLTIIAPSSLHYLVVEDPLPAGCEGVDVSLKTTSVVGEPPELKRVGEEWGWWWFSQTQMRDEKVVLFATYLPQGTYEYTYLMRASVPGQFLVMPANAYEMYFPEVFGRSDGGKFTVASAE